MNEKGPPHLPDEIPKISEPQRLFAGGSRPGHTDTISVSQTAPIANIDALVLIASESDVPRSNEIARRVSVSVPGAHVCSFGPRIRSDLGAIMANEFLRVVAVPLSTSAEDPLLSDLSGLLRRAASRWKNTHFLLCAPIGKTQLVVGWVGTLTS